MYYYIALYIYIYIYIHTYIHIGIYLSLSIYIYLYLYLSLSLYIYIYICIVRSASARYDTRPRELGASASGEGALAGVARQQTASSCGTHIRATETLLAENHVGRFTRTGILVQVHGLHR